MAQAQATSEEDALFSQQESMTYRVQYGPSHLADLSLDIGCDDQQRVGARLFAQSRGMTRRLHPFRVRLDTRANAGDGRALQAQTWIEERGEARRYRSRFTANPQVVTEMLFRENESTEEVELPGPGHDLLSWMLDLRRHVSTQGRQQEEQRYILWDGWKLVWLDVTPGDVEVMETPLGDVRAQAFHLQRTRLHHDSDDRFEAQSRAENLGTIWIEVSTRALPVAMAFNAPIGHVRIHLRTYDRRRCDEE